VALGEILTRKFLVGVNADLDVPVGELAECGSGRSLLIVAWVELYDRVRHAGGVLHNLATDLWTYISLGYFAQIPVPGATGSSTSPTFSTRIKKRNNINRGLPKVSTTELGLGSARTSSRR
jgi:hypothetical protein